MRRLLESHVLKEGMDRGQTDVPRACTISPATFEIIEKLPHKRHVQIFEREGRWSFAQPFFGKAQRAGGMSRDIRLWYADLPAAAGTGDQ